MSALDWWLLVVLAVSALLGLMRGIIGVLASLAAWLLAAWAALRFGGEVAIALDGVVPGPAQVISGYGLCFVVVLLVVSLVGWIVRKTVYSMGLSGLDRALGLLFGVVRGGFVCCALVLLMAFTTAPREASWRSSALVPVFEPGARWLRGWLPDWVAQQVDFVNGGPISATPKALPEPPSGLPGLPAAVQTLPLPKPVLEWQNAQDARKSREDAALKDPAAAP